jgi:hypothetical protein
MKDEHADPIRPDPKIVCAQAEAAVDELGQKLDALGVPFICLVGIPESQRTLRSSKGMEKPDVNSIMGEAVFDYLTEMLKK